MPFPVATRVRYARNPIELVICQLRFPPILRIDTEIPSGFQDVIRLRYPLYEPKSIINLPPGLPAELASIVSQALPFNAGQKSHDFMDATKTWSIALDRESLTLTCRRYESWEEFKDFLGTPLDALQRVYSPPFYLRIGLRYRDVIRRSKLDLSNTDWDELLAPWMAGPYHSPDVRADVERTAHQDLIRLSDRRGRVLINHGVIPGEHPGEWCYAIDSDFSDESQTEHANVLGRLDFFNREARHFFQWCITERLHKAMEPRPISGS